jgi:predicted DNA-binding transcriptional regulator
MVITRIVKSMRRRTSGRKTLPAKGKYNPYSAANVGANRVLKKIEEELEPKVKALDDQLTSISTRVAGISKQLEEIEKSVKDKAGKVGGTGQASQ